MPPLDPAGRRPALFTSPFSPIDDALPPESEPPKAAVRMRSIRHVFRVLLWLLFTAGFALFVGWLSLHWLILPHIDGWRDRIQARASRMLGAPVRIGTIQARSSGWVPALELTDVRVLDAEGRVALALPRVFAALSPRSVFALEPRFSQLLIDGASLDVRRDASGRIRVAASSVVSCVVAASKDSAPTAALAWTNSSCRSNAASRIAYAWKAAERSLTIRL